MTSSDADADAALMLRVRAGDTDAFRTLVERHQRAVIQTIYRAISDRWEAEDLAQKVFLQIYRSAPRYQATAKFTTWLFTIVHNTIRNEYRRRQRRPTESFDALQEGPRPDQPGQQLADDTAPSPAESVAGAELRARIEAAVGELPEPQRTAVILCRFEGLPYEEIAAVLNCSLPAVKSLLHRARQTLKEKLRDCL